MTHPDPHKAIGENIVQLDQAYNEITKRRQAEFLAQVTHEFHTARNARPVSEARIMHVEPASFDDMMSRGELMATAYQWLVYVAVFAAGWATASVTFALMVGG